MFLCLNFNIAYLASLCRMCRSYYWKTWVDTFPKEFSTKSARANSFNGILRLFQDWERMLWCFNDSVSVCVFDRFLTVNSTVDIIQPPLRYSAYRECIYSCRPLMMQCALYKSLFSWLACSHLWPCTFSHNMAAGWGWYVSWQNNPLWVIHS